MLVHVYERTLGKHTQDRASKAEQMIWLAGFPKMALKVRP